MTGEKDVKGRTSGEEGEEEMAPCTPLEFKLGGRKATYFVAGPVRTRVGGTDGGGPAGDLEYTIHTCPARLVPEMVRKSLPIFLV
jgi:hypothetical protein